MDATKVDGCPNEGCGAQVKKYGQALTHFKKECPKIQVKCSFEACGQTLVREDAERHLRSNGCKGLLERCGECGLEGAKKAMKEYAYLCVALVKAKFESVLKEKDLQIERLRGEIQILKSTKNLTYLIQRCLLDQCPFSVIIQALFHIQCSSCKVDTSRHS